MQTMHFLPRNNVAEGTCNSSDVVKQSRTKDMKPIRLLYQCPKYYEFLQQKWFLAIRAAVVWHYNTGTCREQIIEPDSDILIWLSVIDSHWHRYCRDLRTRLTLWVVRSETTGCVCIISTKNGRIICYLNLVILVVSTPHYDNVTTWQKNNRYIK